MKRILSLLLCLGMLLSSFSFTTMADEAVQDEVYQSESSEQPQDDEPAQENPAQDDAAPVDAAQGEPTQDETNASTWATVADVMSAAAASEPTLADGFYQITSASELAWFADAVNAGDYTINAMLLANLDLSAWDWTPIGGGSAATAFQGEFDGAGHTISGLTVSGTTYRGLFGRVSNAVIHDLTLTDASVTASGSYAGILAAYTTDTEISDVTLENVTLTVDTSASSCYAGTLVGSASGGSMDGLTLQHATVTGGAKTYRCGGLFGSASGTTIRNASLADVSVTGYYMVLAVWPVV
ncbi:MAG: glycoside hydrolase family 28 protein [Oscillospiraceae bacterium]|nr:glycoside hydrolase family 28 protein [Oscillospiraceae bacterium]